MFKQITLGLLFSLIISKSIAQSISPDITTEVCPNTEYTFTVNVPGAIQTTSLIVTVLAASDVPSVTQGAYNITGPTVNNPNTVFNFKGKFSDRNNRQIFQVNYSNTSGTAQAPLKFSFDKIKSFFYAYIPNPPVYPIPTTIYPNVTSITSPRCQITTHNISFTNVTYGNSNISPTITYGTVSNYEYLLPNGWKLTPAGSTVTTTSTGTNWIPAANNVTITSDLANGNLSNIRIRPTNTACGAGLAAAGSSQEGLISISRPAPVFSITPGQSTICVGSKNYTLSGASAGSTVSWALSSVTNASLSSPTPTGVTVNRITSTQATVTLTATITDCNSTYTVSTSINLGAPDLIITTGRSGFCVNNYQTWILSAASASGTNWVWSVGNLWPNTNSQIIIFSPNSPTTMVDVRGGGAVRLNYTDLCGAAKIDGITVYTSCQPPFLVAPNPAVDNVTITAGDGTTTTAKSASADLIYSIKITDRFGGLRKSFEYKAPLKSVTVSTIGLEPGIYSISIFNGLMWSNKKLIVQRR